MDSIGSKIKTARKEKGWKQYELAKVAGCYPGDISDWENGKVAPQIASIEKLALALDKPMSYFLGANFGSQGDTEHTPKKGIDIDYLKRLESVTQELREGDKLNDDAGFNRILAELYQWRDRALEAEEELIRIKKRGNHTSK